MADYGVGTRGTLRVTDDGSTVAFYVLCGDPQTRVGEYRWYGTVNGVAVGGQVNLPAGFGSRLLGAWNVGYTQYVNIGQQATGTQGLGGAASFNTYIFRPTVPSPPSSVTVDQITATSARYIFSGNGDGGSGIIEWQAQAATNAAFTANVQIIGSNGSTPFTGLLPGNTYHFRSRGRNAVGWSGWSNTISAYVGLPAPTLNTWAQNSSGGLVATWSAPSTTTGLTGYRLQVARDANFTNGVQNIDVGNVLTATATGLAGGRQYYARVAAVTAGGVNAYSSSLNTMLVLAAGDLDGWTRVGAKPANISYYTTEGIRRGVIGNSQGLYVESLSTGAATLTGGAFGIRKTVTGLTVGKAYRFEAGATLDGNPLAKSYRLEVVSEVTGSAVTVSLLPTSLGQVEFVADATSVVLRIMLASTVTVPGATDEVERVAFHSIKLLELATDYPQRLRETVFESNLANHLDLACNSVGASWYVGADGVTRFRLPGTALPVTAIFSDEDNDGHLHYIDTAAAYDTRSLVNRLDVTNYGVDAERKNEQNDELVKESEESIEEYGVKTERLETNLWSLPPYDESLNNRLDTILDAQDQAERLITSVTWNAQEDLAMASVLDVGQRITVRFNGTEQNSQIVAIQHDITPTRWLMNLDLRKVA